MKAARALKWARLTAGLSQRELAAKTGVPQSTIGRIEAGSVDPRVGTLSRLLRACGYDMEVMERIGIGIDRTLMPPLLARSPLQRLRSAESDARAMRQLDAVRARARHRVG